MKKGDIFHTNGVERREEWRNNGAGNPYGMHAYLWIWYLSFRTLISSFIQVWDCYLAKNSAGKLACKYPPVVVANKLLKRLRLFQLLSKVISVSYTS